ncbi:MAG: Peptidoglycan-binding domain 1 protein [Marmoricola sp.]|nr:Peptidoglycan-binding domain 1 protein [Marmoricola sp.]
MSRLSRFADALRYPLRVAVSHSVVVTLTVGVLAVGGLTVATTTGQLTAASPNPITPGNITGLGFDQCEAPSQAKMTAWRKSSPFRAAGIYISGSLRYCQKQTYLTPEWVRTQLTTGWKLLPIHLGAQASCTTRDRYQKNKIKPTATNDYAAARAQGRNEADIATAAAKQLGIVAKSTLYYDIEAFSIKNDACRISALKFLSAWTERIHQNGYVSGVYSSAASGIKMLDDSRVAKVSTITQPDQVWIADWNNKADTRSTYIRSDGWPGRRIHQYQGGHNETHGGVTINIDRNYLDLRGSAGTPTPTPAPTSGGSSLADPKCTSASISRPYYFYTSSQQQPSLVVPLQCLLKQQHLYVGAVTGKWSSKTLAAVRAWQKKVKHPVTTGFGRTDWISILAAGSGRTTLKPGATGADVIRTQRALNAATTYKLKVTGTYDARTQRVVRIYQQRVGVKPVSGIVANLTWAKLVAGRR